MVADNASFANHGKRHNHLLSKKAEESQQNWLSRIMQDIGDAEEML
jgi:hypothetical protein